MLNLIAFSLLSLQRRWKRQLSLVGVYALVVGFYASIIFFISALKYETQTVLQHIPDIWIQKIAGGRLEPMPLNWADSLKNINGIKQITPRIWGYNFDSPTGAVFTVMGSDSLLQGLELLQTTHKGKLKPTMAICGTGFLEMRGLQISDNITLLDNKGIIHQYEIVGTFKHTSDLITKDLIILHPQEAQKIIGLSAENITDIGLQIYNPDEIDNIARKIDQKFTGIRVVTAQQLRSTYETLFSWRCGIFLYGSILTILAFLVLIWDRATGLSLEEKRELGILKALGWQITDVLWVKLYESFTISIVATTLGIWIGYFHVFVLNAPLLKPLLIGWSVLYPKYELLPIIHLTDLLVIFALAIVPYLSATLIPTWRSAITDPSEIMLNNG